MKINTILFLSILIFFSACKDGKDNDSRVDRLPFYNDATFNTHWIAAGDKKLESFHSIAPFQLFNQDGDTVTNETFDGKIYVTDFFFATCTGICPKMTNNMLLLQKEFLNDNDVLLLSHSVIPDEDSVTALQQYAKQKGIDSKTWHLVTGPKKEIYKLGRQDYFVEEDLGLDKDEDDFLHTENFVLIDKKRHIRGIYNGLNKTSVRQLITDIHTLKQED